MERAPAMRVKVPCNDEGDFYVRLADHVAEHGLRVPAQRPVPIGDRLRVALEFRDGGTLSGEAVVAEHIRLGEGAGLIVRFVRFDRPAPDAKKRASGAKPTPPPPRPAQAATPPPPATPFAAAEIDEAIPEISGAVEIVAPTEASDGGGAPSRIARVTGTVRAALAKGGAVAAGFIARTSRKQRIAIAAAAAVALGGLGLATALMGSTPERQAAAHIAAADRKLAAGHVTGDDGALEHLLEAKRLAPGNPQSAERLAHVADMLEKLGARALRRGDLEVASIHLEGAALAAPDSPGIREKLEALSKKKKESSRQRAAH